MRGKGNHKIPGSFAPENMEKTGAERVKYSLACQHEDAIPIKFVSYAQKCPTVLCTFAVALRKESVDRNATVNTVIFYIMGVALRKESVDRNPGCRYCHRYIGFGSLSARRAWIEILRISLSGQDSRVALRKESVDRNFDYIIRLYRRIVSLSARRAWIEISHQRRSSAGEEGRSPQGERG